MIPTRATVSLPKSFSFVNKNLYNVYSPTSTHQSQQQQQQHSLHHYQSSPSATLHLKPLNGVTQISSAPPFTAPIRPVIRSSGDIDITPTVSLDSIGLDQRPKWKPSSRGSGKLD
jgi:hypothetical protein